MESSGRGFMKRTVIMVVCAAVWWSGSVLAKPDYITRNDDGTIKTRGVYETDEAGKVTFFTVYDGEGALLYKEIPYYADDGRIIRSDRVDDSGALQQVVVFLKDGLVMLDAGGNFVRKGAYSESAFLAVDKKK